MLPVLSAEQVRSIDRSTIEREPVASLDLMERAAKAFTSAFLLAHGPSPRPVLVVCGPGNNGGDGLAIARLLAGRKWPVRVLCPYDPTRSTADNAINLRRLKELPVDVLIGAHRSIPPIVAGEVVIDALFGTGLDRPLAGHYLQLVKDLNACGARIFSVDLPSGAWADGGPDDRSAIVQAEWTCSFQVPKPFMVLPEHSASCGEWQIADIGLDRQAIASCASLHHLVEPGDVSRRLANRPRNAHKGSFGHALIVAGGQGHLGAAVMATAAATRSGAGLVTAFVPPGGAQAIHCTVPEAMVVEDGPMPFLSSRVPEGRWSAVGVGPGIGQSEATVHVLDELMRTFKGPIVFDADALNILAATPGMLGSVPAGSVLTPHPGEADRLFGASIDTRERIRRASAFAQQRRVVVVLKGANTAICLADGRVLYNATGNAGLAKGGSGDALTGLITGSLAQGLSAEDAAVVGVWVHGLAGDLAAAELGQDGMTVMDVIRAVPHAFRRGREGGEWQKKM